MSRRAGPQRVWAPPRSWIAVPRGRTRLLLAAVLGAVVAAALVVLAVLAWPRGAHDVTRGARLPGTAPAEWSSESRWRTPALATDGGRGLVVGGDGVAVVSQDRRVVLIDLRTGDVRWEADLPPGELRSDLASTTVDGSPAVAAHVGERLLWWAADDGEPGGVDVPAGARATFLGPAPLVGTARGSVAVVRRGSLDEVAVPRGALALAARQDGTVTAASPSGWWHLRPGTVAEGATPWESPAGTVAPTIVSYSAGSILAVLSTPSPRLLVYADRAQDVRFSFAAPLAAPPAEVTWRAAPGGTWGILDRLLVDLEAGRAVDLGAWTTTHIALDRALGRIGDQAVLAGPAIPRGVLRDGEGFPEDVTAAGALVRGEDGGHTYLYLLPPALAPAAPTG